VWVWELNGRIFNVSISIRTVGNILLEWNWIRIEELERSEGTVMSLDWRIELEQRASLSRSHLVILVE
jgi:hypothetical protein